ncbi:MAG: hypothetical protein EP329_08825, partial [Deltaproteobacteria bacterium]
MWIERVAIEGFGQFSGFELGGFEPGLVVVHGPNEAGKSTLRQFVRWMLFDARRGENQRWSGPGGQLAGSLGVRLADGSATLVREGRNVELRRPRNVAQKDSAALAPLLRGMDSALFDAIFTFDLFDLQQIGALREEHVQNLLAVGATLGAGQHPAAIVKKLDGQAEAYLKKTARSVEIPQAMAEIKRIQAHLREARKDAERYGAVVADADAAATRLVELRAQRGAVVAQQREVAQLQKMWPVWNGWRALDEEASGISAAGPRIPKETRARLSRAREAARTALEAARRADEAYEAAVAARDEVAVDEALLASGATLDDLVAKLEHVEARSDELRDLRQREVEGRLRLEATLGELGAGWDEERLKSVLLDASVEAEARRHVGETASLAVQVPAELTGAEDEVRRVDGELAELDAELAALPAEPDAAHMAAAESILAEATARVEDAEAAVALQVRVAEIEADAPSEAPTGWPEVGATDLTAVERHAAAWRDATAEHAARVRASSERVADAELALAQAEGEAHAAKALPGEGVPAADVVAGLEARWPSVRDELARGRHLEAEIAQHEDAIAKLPARVGRGVDVAALERVDASAEARALLERAYEAVAATERARGEARA